MNNQKPSLGLVLGRFQPLHPGHLALIDTAYQENDFLVVCIGSAQKAEPYTIGERHEKMQRQLTALKHDPTAYRIVDLIDPEPIDIWPTYVKEICAITDDTQNTLYRGEDLPSMYIEALESIGIQFRRIERIPFYLPDQEGIYHKFQSATDVRNFQNSRKERE